jgi:hypothetical protein
MNGVRSGGDGMMHVFVSGHQVAEGIEVHALAGVEPSLGQPVPHGSVTSLNRNGTSIKAVRRPV